MELPQLKKNIGQRAGETIKEFRHGEHRRHVRRTAIWAAVALVLFLGAYHFSFSPPKEFPTGTLVEVPEGATGREIVRGLHERNVVRSEAILKLFTSVLGGKDGILYGEYYFEVPESVFGIAKRLVSGEFGLDAVRVTIPEGATVAQIAEVLDHQLPSFPKDRFLALAHEREGYLFPDTYFFLPNVAPRHIIEVMEKNFEKKVEELEYADQGTSLEELVIMASIIEKEAREPEDKKIISGILWKRLEIGMPLQVDAPFVYAIGKNTFQLTTEDLQTDNPYNTYTRLGLPPTPIANPGLESLDAALNPKESPYLFFLSDRRGNMHYAENFEQHKQNKRLHLN